MGMVSEEYKGRKFIDFHLKYSTLTQNLKSTIRGGYPRFPKTSRPKVQFEESSSLGEFHPQALTDPDVNVSAHPALIIPSPS